MDDHLLVFLGILFIVVGIMFIFFSFVTSDKVEGEGVVVGFVGFVPFGFATSKKALLIGMVLTIILLIVLLLIMYRGGA